MSPSLKLIITTKGKSIGRPVALRPKKISGMSSDISGFCNHIPIDCPLASSVGCYDNLESIPPSSIILSGSFMAFINLTERDIFKNTFRV